MWQFVTSQTNLRILLGTSQKIAKTGKIFPFLFGKDRNLSYTSHITDWQSDTWQRYYDHRLSYKEASSEANDILVSCANSSTVYCISVSQEIYQNTSHWRILNNILTTQYLLLPRHTRLLRTKGASQDQVSFTEWQNGFFSPIRVWNHQMVVGWLQLQVAKYL